IADVDMKHLRGADAIVNLYAERLKPALVKFDGQSFSCRITKAQTGKVLTGCSFRVKHPINHRRYSGQDRWTVFCNRFKQLFRRRSLREKGGRRPNREGKQKICSSCIPKEKLWHRNSKVLFV